MEKTYYKISEVAEIVGETQPTLRFWEKESAKYLDIKKVKGTRYYTSKNVETIKNIQFLLRQSDYKIDGAKIKLANDNRKTANNRNITDRLTSIRDKLVAVRKEINELESFN